MAATNLMTKAMRGGLGRGISRGTLQAGRMPAAGALVISRRGLGDTVRGPPLTDVAANLRIAQEFFTKDAISYAEYKQQLVSLRVFAFGAVVLGCITGLVVSPPKSSYWATYGPISWFSYFRGCFSNDSPSLFLKNKVSAETDVAAIVGSMLDKETLEAAPAAKSTSAKVAAPATDAATQAPAAAEVAPVAKDAESRPREPISLQNLIIDRSGGVIAADGAPVAVVPVAVVEKEAAAEAVCEKCAGATKHAAIVFIKPHAVCDKVKYLMDLKLRCSGITVNSEGSIAAEKIDKEQLIDQHYGAIAAKAVKLKPDTLTVQPKAQENFETTYGISWADALKAGRVYNAMDAAQKLGLSTDELGAEWRKGKTIKFGGGFYCAQMDDMFVINGFYMDMRTKFTAPGTSIYYYDVQWDPKDLSWADFREKILGGTDPKTAHLDSARHLIYSNWAGLGLKSCPTTGDNGVHASASPFEAMAERANWLGASIENDFYGKALVANGVPLDMVKSWCDDPAVNFEGKKQSLFDLLEDMDAEDCLLKSTKIASAN